MTRLQLTGQIGEFYQLTSVVVLRVDPGSVVSLCASKNSDQRVIILHRNRVGLVVVTSGTGDRGREKSAARSIQLLVNEVGGELGFVLIGEAFWTNREKAGGNEQAGSLRLVVIRQEISGNLFCEKLIVGHISIY